MADRAAPRSRPAAGGLIRPMLATAGPVPVGPGWAFEVKFDGVRAIGYAGPSGLTLYSRNDRDISRSYPEIAALELGEGVIVDGELVALDGHGRPDFGLLQHRMHVTTPTAELIERVPVQYVVFDLLHHGDRSLLEAALRPTTRTSGRPRFRTARAESPGQLHRRRRRGGARRDRAARPGGCGRETTGLALSTGAPVAGVDQDPDPAHRRGHHRGLVTQHRQRERVGFVAARRARLGDCRAHALLQDLLMFRLLPSGFLNRDLRGLLAELLASTRSPQGKSARTYDDCAPTD